MMVKGHRIGSPQARQAQEAPGAPQTVADRLDSATDHRDALDSPDGLLAAIEQTLASKDRIPRYSNAKRQESLGAIVPHMKAKAVAKGKGNGKPIKYSQALGEEIAERMLAGAPLDDVISDMGLARSTVYRWKREHPGFETLITAAREGLAQFAFAETARIPRQLLDLPDEKLTSARVGAARLLVESMRWWSERLAPAQFADQSRQRIELTGANGSPLNQPMVIDARSLPDEQREAVREALIALRAKQINQ